MTTSSVGVSMDAREGLSYVCLNWSGGSFVGIMCVLCCLSEMWLLFLNSAWRT